MIIPILLLGLILRLINLNQSLWLDEATQAILSQDSINNIFFNHGADFHPPLSYMLMHFWIQFDNSEVWLRLLSVIFAILTIWIIFLIVKKLFSEKIALKSAFLLGISPYHIYYSQEVRMYSEAVFFSALSMYFLIKLFEKNNLILICSYVISTTALLYTHYDGFFLVATQIIYVLFYRKEKIKDLLIYLIGIFVLWSFWIPQFLKQLQSGVNIDQSLPGWRNILSLSPLKAFPLTIFKFIAGRISFDNAFIYFLVAGIVLLITAFILLKVLAKFTNKNIMFIAFWFFIPLILSFLVSFKLPLNQPFRLLYTLPALFILISLGLTELGKIRKTISLVFVTIMLFGLFLYYFNPKFWREDWKGATNFVKNEICQNCSAVFVWPDVFPPYEWYKGAQGIGVVKSFPASKDQIDYKMQAVVKKDQIYLFQYLQDLSDPNHFTQKWLESNNFKLIQTYDFRGVGFIFRFKKE